MENIAGQDMPKKGMRLKTRRNLIGYTFIAPALIIFVIFVVIPLILSVYLSFFQASKYFRNMTFVGFKNFRDVFADQIFLKSLGNIGLYALMAVPANIFLSLMLALLLNAKKRGTKVFRVLFYLPSVTSAVAASMVWMWLMKPSGGLLNNIFKAFGLPPSTWLSHSNTALFSVTIVTVWMGLGGNMIIFLAALQGLPQEIYEAADIDGAGPVRSFFKLTIPFLAPTMFFLLTMTLIGAFQLYDQVFVLTQGGPNNSTMTPVYLIWQKAFGRSPNLAGYASAMSFVLFIIIMLVTVVVQFLMRRINRDV